MASRDQEEAHGTDTDAVRAADVSLGTLNRQPAAGSRDRDLRWTPESPFRWRRFLGNSGNALLGNFPGASGPRPVSERNGVSVPSV